MEDSIINTGNKLIHPENIEIQIKCEIGKVNISLNKLLGLKIGDTLKISDWPQNVKLVANGNNIAEGFLVEINGMLGIKISKSFTNSYIANQDKSSFDTEGNKDD